jgi:hypothetical protein
MRISLGPFSSLSSVIYPLSLSRFPTSVNLLQGSHGSQDSARLFNLQPSRTSYDVNRVGSVMARSFEAKVRTFCIQEDHHFPHRHRHRSDAQQRPDAQRLPLLPHADPPSISRTRRPTGRERSLFAASERADGANRRAVRLPVSPRHKPAACPVGALTTAELRQLWNCPGMVYVMTPSIYRTVSPCRS